MNADDVGDSVDSDKESDAIGEELFDEDFEQSSGLARHLPSSLQTTGNEG